MQDSVVLLVFRFVLVVIMLGLGLSLTVQDFRNVVLEPPRRLIVALVLQTIVLPAPSVSVSPNAFELGPALAVWLMLLAASLQAERPRISSRTSRGDVALNIT